MAVEAAGPPPAKLKPADQVEMVDGRKYAGLIESEDNVWIHLAQLKCRDGRPMHMVIRSLDRAKVHSVVRLDPARRSALRRDYGEFRNRARIEAGRKEAIELRVVQKGGTRYRQYHGAWFTLESSVNEETTRWLVVRIEQIFTAYRQILPPRTKPQSRLRIVVLGSMAEYQAYLEPMGLAIKNPACFIGDDNLIVAGSELTPFAAELAKIKTHHDRLRKHLETKRKQLIAELAEEAREAREAGLAPAEIAKRQQLKRNKAEREIKKLEAEMDSAERTNERKFEQVTRRMFPRLYHEAFHAYLENYVYPGEKFDVPRWLNEGLAVMFEAGFLEGATLRVDAPNRPALQRLKADLKGGQPLPLEELLCADQGVFISRHHSDVATSGRHYVYSWGLAYYLTFPMRRLGSASLDQYASKPAKDTTPVVRFEKLVGMPLADFQRRWRAYILNLR